MPSVTYMNQSAPFWDFIASLEQQGANHPLLSGENSNNNANADEDERGEGHEHHHESPASDPWGWGNFFGRQTFPHRGPPPHGPPHHHHEAWSTEKDAEKDHEKNDEEMRDGNEYDNGEGPSANSGSDNEGGRGRHGRCRGRRRGHCGRGGRGGMGGFDGPWGGSHGHHHGPHHRSGPWGGPFSSPFSGPHHHGGPRGFGRRRGWGWGGPWSHGAFDPTAFVAQFWEQFNNTGNENKAQAEEQDHTPDADIFDTETAYVVHVSLPGAKKEDVGVNWDAEKSELSIAGVIYRPGDEEFLRTLAMNERKVGPFERKIRLGTRATPAHVDAESITAKLEDGVLRVEVPKLDSGYVEVRKVDIE